MKIVIRVADRCNIKIENQNINSSVFKQINSNLKNDLSTDKDIINSTSIELSNIPESNFKNNLDGLIDEISKESERIKDKA